jgi:hypothetical protein
MNTDKEPTAEEFRFFPSFVSVFICVHLWPILLVPEVGPLDSSSRTLPEFEFHALRQVGDHARGHVAMLIDLEHAIGGRNFS